MSSTCCKRSGRWRNGFMSKAVSRSLESKSGLNCRYSKVAGMLRGVSITSDRSCKSAIWRGSSST
jgi:hypothetical protein